jgi:hypothetical protein
MLRATWNKNSETFFPFKHIEQNLLSRKEMTSIQGEYSEFDVTKTALQLLFKSGSNSPKPQFTLCLITI